MPTSPERCLSLFATALYTLWHHSMTSSIILDVYLYLLQHSTLYDIIYYADESGLNSYTHNHQIMSLLSMHFLKVDQFPPLLHCMLFLSYSKLLGIIITCFQPMMYYIHVYLPDGSNISASIKLLYGQSMETTHMGNIHTFSSFWLP